MNDKTERAYDLIREFNREHNLNRTNQTLMLNSEVGEISDEILRRNPQGIAEELGDVLFVALSIADLVGVDWEDVLYRTSVENSKKEGSKDGEKVTKEGLEDED